MIVLSLDRLAQSPEHNPCPQQQKQGLPKRWLGLGGAVLKGAADRKNNYESQQHQESRAADVSERFFAAMRIVHYRP